MIRIPEAMKPALQGVAPAVIATCAPDGTPNVSFISQVFFVDDEHIAVSHQFFSKTAMNVRANPHAFITAIDPNTMDHWALDVAFDRSESDGPLFDEMSFQLEAIAAMTGMSEVFKLKAADVYKVLRIRRIPLGGPPVDGEY